MIKTLLRTIPTISGNVKLACNLTDYIPVPMNDQIKENTLFEANIRGARILPISSQLYQKEINANLLSSTWEHDLKLFYKSYSDVFFKSCFDFDKLDMLKLDKYHEQYVRDTDFEFGVKRISYQKNGNQFAFFAPIYIDNSKDIPGWFDINLKINTGTYFVYKTIRVDIANKPKNKKSYIYNYIKNYTDKLNKDVIFCTPLTNQATYYGIDLQHGGFVKAVDNMCDRIYRKQNTIHNFDATICDGFKRNRIAMKQILPLCFYFNVNNILTEAEKLRYRNCDIEFSGAYYDVYGRKLYTYDWDHDYVQYAEQILEMDDITGTLYWNKGFVPNIMNVGFPSLAESRYINYEYANKLSPRFCRWKMRYSDDEHPYTMNNSWAFSLNQKSNYKYGQFPNSFHTLTMLADYIKVDFDYFYNLTFPLGDPYKEDSGVNKYRELGVNYPPKEYDENGEEIPSTADVFRPYANIISDYKSTIEDFVSYWFNTIHSLNDNIFKEASLWRDVDDGCVYYNGILYDLRQIYNMIPEPTALDKFAVLLQVDMETFDEELIKSLTFADMCFYPKYTERGTLNNCSLNDSLLYNATEAAGDGLFLYSNVEYETNGQYKDSIEFNEIFRKSATNTGYFIDINNATYRNSHSYEYYVDYEGWKTGYSYTYGILPIDYWQTNKYYNVEDIDKLSNLVSINGDNLDGLFDAVYPEGEANFTYTYTTPNDGESHELPTDGMIIPDYVQSENSNSYILGDISAKEFISTYVISDLNNKFDNVVNNISSYAAKGYVQVPIYKSWRITYDNNGKLNNYMINIPLDINSTYINTGLYVNNIDKMIGNHKLSRTKSAMNNGDEIYSIWDPDKNATTYGNMLHMESYMLSASYLPGLTSHISYELIWEYAKDVIKEVTYRNKQIKDNDEYGEYQGPSYECHFTYEDLFNRDLISYWSYYGKYTYSYTWTKGNYATYTQTYEYSYNPIKTYHPCAYLMGALEHYMSSIYTNVDQAIYDNDIPEYEYHPVQQTQGENYDGRVFVRRNKYTNRFYGDLIPLNHKDRDLDVLWVDQYNLEVMLRAGFKDYLETLGLKMDYIKNEINPVESCYKIFNISTGELVDTDLTFDYPWDKIRFDKTTGIVNVDDLITTYDTHDMFVKFLNKQHIYYYNIELYKNDDKKSPYSKWADSWYKTLYAAEKKWWWNKDTKQFEVKILYTPFEKLITCENKGVKYVPTFFEVYNSMLSFNHSNGLFKLSNYPNTFDLCYRKPMYRMDKRLWDTSNMDINVDKYRDLYVYKIQSGVENDERLLNYKKIDFVGEDLFNMPQYDLNNINGIWVHDISKQTDNDGNESVETETDQGYEYKLLGEPHIAQKPVFDYSKYGLPEEEDINMNELILDIDTMLTPLFDDVFIQGPDEAVIYAHYSLHDISVSEVVDDINPLTGERPVIEHNYRFNKNDKKALRAITEEEREKYHFTETYDLYDNNRTELVVDDNYNRFGYKNFHLNTWEDPETGEKYGFYLIKAFINNTTNTFKVVAYKDGERIDNVKYIPMINGIDITKNTGYLTDIYKNLLPFMKQNPLTALGTVNTIVYPNTYSLLLEYTAGLENNYNNSSEINIIQNQNNLKTLSLLRYFHAMTPLIVPTSDLLRSWRLKLKDVDKTLLDTGKYLSLGDAPIYSSDMHINKYVPRNIYTASINPKDIADYNNLSYEYTPLEYKHFNASKMINMQEMFEIKVNKPLSYEDLLKFESDEEVFKQFKKYINNSRKTKYNDDQLVFLLNKYDVQFDSTPDGLDMFGTKKLFKLKYRFNLL